MEINKKRLVVTIVIILLIFSGIEIGIKNYFDGRKDNFTEDLNSGNYDLILIGNSMLGHNVNISILEDELSQSTGRKISSKIFYFDGRSFPLWYLLIKNRIAASQKSNIPVVIIGHITEPWTVANRPGDNVTRLYMAVDEPDFYRIRGTPVSFTDTIERSSSILFAREDVAAAVLREFIKEATIERYPDGESVLKKRFAIGQFREQAPSVQHLQPLSDLLNTLPAQVTGSSKTRVRMTEEDYLKHGFFPEIIRVTQGRFPLVYVDSHLYPANDTEKLKNSRKILGKFLSENNVTYIDLNQREELNNTELYADLAHFHQKNFVHWKETSNVSGIEINSRIIARELLERKVIQ